MDNDLINRSELKSVLENECFWCANRDEPCDKSCWRCINEKIDNAPIVDLWQMRQEATENALKKAEVLYARPQGEWLVSSEDAKAYTICSNCFYKASIEWNCVIRCPNCNAKMKTKQ